MKVGEKLFKEFINGIQEWLPNHYSYIMNSLTIDTVGYNMGLNKEPIYIFDFLISENEINKLESLSKDLKNKSIDNKIFDEELFKKYDSLAGFISILKFNYKK